MFDEFSASKYNENLYRYDNVATGISSLDSVTDEHDAYYRDNGFLVIQNACVLENIKAPFPKISYTECVELLNKAGFDINWGDDFGSRLGGAPHLFQRTGRKPVHRPQQAPG